MNGDGMGIEAYEREGESDQNSGRGLLMQMRRQMRATALSKDTKKVWKRIRQTSRGREVRRRGFVGLLSENNGPEPARPPPEAHSLILIPKFDVA